MIKKIAWEAHKLAEKYNIEMPIVNTVYDVLYNGLKPKDAVIQLMTREKKCEWNKGDGAFVAKMKQMLRPLCFTKEIFRKYIL